MGSNGRRCDGARPHVRARTARIAATLAAATAMALAGCGLGPFAGSTGASDSSALASPGPEVTAEPEPSPVISGQSDPNSAVGALVEGFPADLLPVPAGAEVLVSSVEPIGDSGAYQVSLNLRTVLEAAEVVDIYRTSLTAAGFAEIEQTAPDVALAAQSTFTRSSGDELLVIGVLDRDGVRTVTIGGRLRAGD